MLSYDDAQERMRFHVSTNMFVHPPLSSLNTTTLFRLCRNKGFAINVQENTGIAFNFVDNLSSGCLAIICVHKSVREAVNMLYACLCYLRTQLYNSRTAQSTTSTQLTSLIDVLRNVQLPGEEKELPST
eukprot:gnl/Spiro4/9669_TR5133_c0_g2_i2.p1 gnl/Spiro4/9669_TR5133_c0_g2~~gnl/Spiro4/9669_TR5133_c0_g2_i2.p1  ORF type:complete len:129 (-),score=41.04 gnl/Spiro4/9669_TR5133_c0_g2_i2:200-586(-)